MALKIHNTLTGSIDELIPGGEKKESIKDYPPVTIYSCGPTVYSYAHIGNFRYFTFADFLRRYLKFKGYTVSHAMNITDVDDKIIAGTKETETTLEEYTEKFTQIFFEDLKALNIEKLEHYPKATESIDAMIDIITELKEKEIIYEKDGSIYFSIAKFNNYGKLSRLNTREIKSGLRYDTDEYEKDDIRDFALWKATDKNNIGWDTPFGRGRPGWHIECSAMIRKLFKGTIDIHTGGVDLIFPHHENEIAQSEAAYGDKFVRHWIHGEHLLVNNSKMSKSLGNYYTLRDLIDKGYSPRSIRYLLLSVHYRKQLNFTFDGLDGTKQTLERIDNLIFRLNDIKNEGVDFPDLQKILDNFVENFTQVIDDDLNVAGSLGIFFDFVHHINSLISDDKLSVNDRDSILDILKKIDSVFGFIFFEDEKQNDVDESWIESMIEERLESRKNKNFTRADEIRDELIQKGIILEDTKDGTRWKIKK